VPLLHPCWWHTDEGSPGKTLWWALYRKCPGIVEECCAVDLKLKLSDSDHFPLSLSSTHSHTHKVIPQIYILPHSFHGVMFSHSLFKLFLSSLLLCFRPLSSHCFLCFCRSSLSLIYVGILIYSSQPPRSFCSRKNTVRFT